MVSITPAKYNPLTMPAPKAPVKLLPKKKVDFSSIMPKVGVIDPLAQAKVGTQAKGLYNITPSIQKGAVAKSASDIGKTKQVFVERTNTGLQDVIATYNARPDMTEQEFMSKFPEFKGKGQAVADFVATYNAKPNMTKEYAMEKFPELYELPTTQTRTEQTLSNKIMGGISKAVPFISPLAGVVQNIGVKNILDAGVGILEGGASVGNAIGQGLAYIDPTITVDEYKKGNENIDAKIPQAIKDIRQTQGYGIGKEIGKIGASTALARPIGGAAKGVGLLGKAALGATEGVLGAAAYNVASGDDAFNTTSGIVGAIGGAIPLVGAGIKAGAKYIAPRLQLSGLLNPAKLTQVKNMLIEEGSELIGKNNATDVGNWMIERGFKGGKEGIVEGLIDYSNKSRKALDDVLASSKSKHNITSARKALESLKQSYGDTPGLEQSFAKIDDLLSKKSYSLSELNIIKREIDNAYNLFKTSGGDTAGLRAEGLRNIRRDIRKYIEDIADAEGLGNVKMLNNETSISRTLADAVSKKDSADIAREMLSVFSKPAIGGALSINTGPFQGDGIESKIGNFIVGGLLAGALFSTSSKTYLANALRGMSGLQKKELSRFIATKGSEKLSQETLEKVGEITTAIKLLKEGPLESNPLRLTTPPKTRTLLPGATQQTNRPLSIIEKNATPINNPSSNNVGNNSTKGVENDILGRYGAGNRGLTDLSDKIVDWNNYGTEKSRKALLQEYDTEKGKAFLNDIIEAIPKNKDGTITAYRTGKIGGNKAQSYTLSEGMSKTFSNQGTDIPITFGSKTYDNFGSIETNKVTINVKGIKGYSPYDKEILVEPKFIIKSSNTIIPSKPGVLDIKKAAQEKIDSPVEPLKPETANQKLSDNMKTDLSNPKKPVQSDTLVSKSDSMSKSQPLIVEARKYKSADEFVYRLDDKQKSKLLKPIKDNVDNIDVSLESTCVDCIGGADFVESQMNKAVEISKNSAWGKKIKDQRQWGEKKTMNRLNDYDTRLYLNDEYLIFKESGIENFYKLEGAEKINMESQLKQIREEANSKGLNPNTPEKLKNMINEDKNK